MEYCGSKRRKILKEGLPNMEFDMKDNKVHGNAGCNIFNSTVVLDDQDISSITINPAATTMMACPDMEIEDAILKAMGNVKGVKAGQSENEMLLVDADGNVLMVLSKTNWIEMKKYMYLCLAALSIGIFASCKAKKVWKRLSPTWMVVGILSN